MGEIMRASSKSSKILLFIAKKQCREYTELKQYASEELGITENHLKKILSVLAKRKFINRYWSYIGGRKRRRYCINPSKVLLFELD